MRLQTMVLVFKWSGVGDFKGAVEPFTSTSFSEENRIQIKRLLNLRWNDYIAKISSNRER